MKNDGGGKRYAIEVENNYNQKIGTSHFRSVAAYSG
jgi:hypothetical protein